VVLERIWHPVRPLRCTLQGWQSIIPPEKKIVVVVPANEGFPAMTKWGVMTRGKQQDVQVGD
jgi:hypothetical protein